MKRKGLKELWELATHMKRCGKCQHMMDTKPLILCKRYVALRDAYFRTADKETQSIYTFNAGGR